MSGCCAGVSLVEWPRARKTDCMDVEITLRVNSATWRPVLDSLTVMLEALRERLGMSGSLCRCAAYANIVPASRRLGVGSTGPSSGS